MNQEKYIGMDVHQATISVAVLDGRGKLIMKCILETKADTILEFVRGLQGDLSVAFEEGTSPAWLHDLLKPHVAHLVVCDPRKNALGVPDMVIQRILRHANVSTTATYYIKTAAADVRSAMTKLENHIAEADGVQSDTNRTLNSGSNVEPPTIQ